MLIMRINADLQIAIFLLAIIELVSIGELVLKLNGKAKQKVHFCDGGSDERCGEGNYNIFNWCNLESSRIQNDRT